MESFILTSYPTFKTTDMNNINNTKHFLIFFQHTTGSSNIWYLEIDLPQNVAITYRYFICSMDPTSENVHVRRFETHIEPRTIPIDGASSQTDQETKIDTLGDIDGSIKLDRGWLTSETIIQFKFFDNPFLVKERIKNRLLYVKVSMIVVKFL